MEKLTHATSSELAIAKWISIIASLLIILS
jgi:hypothetical protein